MNQTQPAKDTVELLHQLNAGCKTATNSVGQMMPYVQSKRLLHLLEDYNDMLELAQDVGHRLRVHELAARGVQIYIRGNNLAGAQFQCKLPFRTQLPSELAHYGYKLFTERYRWTTKVRAVCIRAIDLIPQSDVEQLDLFIDTAKRDRRARLEDAVEDIRRRYGKRAVTYAVLMGDLKMPGDGREIVRMPSPMYQ